MNIPYRITIEIASTANGKGVATITVTGETPDIRAIPGEGVITAYEGTKMAAAILSQESKRAEEVTADRAEFEASMAFHNMPTSGRPN